MSKTAKAAKAPPIYSAPRGFEIRTDDRREFDELVTLEGVACEAHLEMMSDRCLWMRLSLPDGSGVALFISANAKLHITCDDD